MSRVDIALPQRRTIPPNVILCPLVPCKKTPIIAEMQKRVDEIQTEAARLAVFANTMMDIALAGSLKKIAKTVFRSATQIERNLAKLRRAQ